MKYNIISLNDDRKVYKDAIREHVGLDEYELEAVDGRAVDIREELNKRNMFTTGWVPKQGEAGVWLSNYDRWMDTDWIDEPLVVFEDDAIIDESFKPKLDGLMEDLPEDWDFLALWVPENQHADYQYITTYDFQGDPQNHGSRPYSMSQFKLTYRLAHVYQGYGMVALAYSPAGGRNLVSLAQQYGMYTPVDCFVYQQAHMGNLKGFAPSPIFANVVRYDWRAESHVQLTERVEF